MFHSKQRILTHTITVSEIFNADRTYHLGRTQLLFLTNMALPIYDQILHELDALD